MKILDVTASLLYLKAIAAAAGGRPIARTFSGFEISGTDYLALSAMDWPIIMLHPMILELANHQIVEIPLNCVGELSRLEDRLLVVRWETIAFLLHSRYFPSREAISLKYIVQAHWAIDGETSDIKAMWLYGQLRRALRHSDQLFNHN